MELNGHAARTKTCRVFCNNTKAVSTSDDNTLRVWDLRTHECEQTLGCDRSELLEHREPAVFPKHLGPFGAQETTLRPAVDFKKLQYVLPREQLESLKHCSEQSRELWEILEKGDMSAAISKPSEITLPKEFKPAAGIPEAATHFVWAHQLKAAEKLKDEQIEKYVKLSGEAAFVINGGYLYFKIREEMATLDHTEWTPTEDGKPILVQANGLCTSGLVKFQFSDCVWVKAHNDDAKEAWRGNNVSAAEEKAQRRAIDKMIRSNRFQRVTITPLRNAGARYYCWVRPGEDLLEGTKTDRKWKPCEHGGFMYLLTDDDDDPDAEDYQGCCYFELSLGHTSWVRGCCLTPDETQVLSCSADCSLWLWDLKTGKSVKKLVGHSNWVWDCCTYTTERGELRAVSCSSDRTVRVWDLQTGEEVKGIQMQGHKDWVMSCCVYSVRGRWRALSSSKDKTVRSWDLENGHLLKTFKGHEDMVGGCEVYKENGENWTERARGVACEADRALTCSDDRTLRVWDLVANAHLYTLRGHTDLIIACCLFRDRDKDNQYGVSCSADGVIGVWNLNGSEEPERFLQDTDEARVRGCAAFSDGSKLLWCSGNSVRVWDRELLAMTEPSRKDVRLNMEQETELLWRWWKHMALHEHKAWAQKLWDVMNPPGKEQLTPFDCQTLLYSKGRDGATLIHRLANEDDGAAVMKYILDKHKEWRRKAVLGAEGNELIARQAEMTLGLISRAGNSHGQSALSVAMNGFKFSQHQHKQDTEGQHLRNRESPIKTHQREDVPHGEGCGCCRGCRGTANGHKQDTEGQQLRNRAKNALMARLLLNDYCEMVNAVKRDHFTGQQSARYHRFDLLSESDAVDLFFHFPRDAASFLQRLPLRPTRDLRPDGYDFIRCDIHDPAFSARMMVKSAPAMQPKRGKKPEKPNEHREPQDMLWWEKMIEDRFYSRGHSAQTISTETKTWLVPIVANTAAPGSQSRRLDNYITTARNVSHLPFSNLLKESCRYAETTGSVELFEAPVLKAIICHKWDAGCRKIFMIHFVLYVIYLALLTGVILFDHLHKLSDCDPDTLSCGLARVCWYICCVFSASHVKFEVHQLNLMGRGKYMSTTWNQLGIASVSITVIALALMRVPFADQSMAGIGSATLRVIQTLALFSRWLKVLLFMRGLDSTAPLMKLLSNIVTEMRPFLVLLLVILACFSFVFCLLLRDTESDREEYGTIYDSFLRTYGMILGNFHTQWFDDADTGGLATGLFVMFTVSVTVVMLNALIAIMSDTYDRSKRQENANGRLMRANLILELESLIVTVKACDRKPDESWCTRGRCTHQREDGPHGEGCGCCRGTANGCVARLCAFWSYAVSVFQVLMTFRIRGDDQAAGQYLHVLSFEDPASGPEQEYELTSYPFESDVRDGAPAVAIGDSTQRESLFASKADVEKLMAQNVQLMTQMKAMADHNERLQHIVSDMMMTMQPRQNDD